MREPAGGERDVRTQKRLARRERRNVTLCLSAKVFPIRIRV